MLGSCRVIVLGGVDQAEAVGFPWAVQTNTVSPQGHMSFARVTVGNPPQIKVAVQF